MILFIFYFILFILSIIMIIYLHERAALRGGGVGRIDAQKVLPGLAPDGWVDPAVKDALPQAPLVCYAACSTLM